MKTTTYADTPLPSLRVADIAEQERPRERAMRQGVNMLTDAELLAIVLGSGTEGLSVIDLAKAMLASCGNSLNRLAQLSPREMSRKFKGVGPAKAITLLSAFQLGMRCSAETPADDPQIKSSRDVYDLMASTLRHIDHEEFWVLMLSQANRVKERHLVSRGGMAATVVDVRLVMREAIQAGAAGIIAVHNHPSGNRQPSGQDDQLTRRIADAAKTLDIRMLDHIIIAGSGFFSYRDDGRL